jgi:hypothetical protein
LAQRLERLARELRNYVADAPEVYYTIPSIVPILFL